MTTHIPISILFAVFGLLIFVLGQMLYWTKYQDFAIKLLSVGVILILMSIPVYLSSE